MGSSRPYNALIVGGIVGLIVCVLLLRSLHPDAAAPDIPSRQEATDVALGILKTRGIQTDSLLMVVELRRDQAILQELVRERGRTAAMEALRSNWIPARMAWVWQVDFRRGTSGGSPLIRIVLDHRLRNVGFRAADESVALRPDRDALAIALGEEASATFEGELQAIPDSLLHSAARIVREAETSDSASFAERIAMLTSEDMERVASHHLNQSGLAGGDWRSGQMVIGPLGDVFSAAYTFADSIAGNPISANLEFGADGRLISLIARYEAEEERASQIAVILLFVGLLALLGIFLLVEFLRRFTKRQIDLPTALLDAVVVGLAVGAMLVLSRSGIFNPGSGALWQQILISGLTFGVSSAAVMLGAFVVSGATGSMTREVWEHKLASFDLLRRGNVINRAVGSALINGTALAFVMGGLVLSVVMLLPKLPLSAGPLQMTDSVVGFPAGFLAGKVASSFFMGSLLLLAAGSFVRRRSRSPAAVVLVLAILAAGLRAGPLSVASEPLGAIPNAVAGAVLALAFLRFDFVTCAVAMFMSASFFDLAEPMLMGGEAIPGALAMGAVAAAIPAIGIAGWRSKRTGRENGAYIPPYLVEMASEERLKREVEIAREVQESFLPKKMPSIEGLDVHGVCIPATEVGGDYFDLIPLSGDRLVVLVGDVSGKGFQAAFFMTLAKGIVQTLASEDIGPKDLLGRFNRLFHSSVPARTFISMACGIADPRAGTFTFARAGHNPVIHWSSETGSATALQPSGMAVGFDAGPRFERAIEEVTLTVCQGDRVVLYTDGLSEAMDSERALYGDERLREKVMQLSAGESASASVDGLIQDVVAFAGDEEQHDDMTLVVVSF